MEANINLSQGDMQLPHYTKSKDFLIFLRVVPLHGVVFNAIIFGRSILVVFVNFLLASLVTFFIITYSVLSLTWIAVLFATGSQKIRTL
jgi:hypothetical protein